MGNKRTGSEDKNERRTEHRLWLALGKPNVNTGMLMALGAVLLAAIVFASLPF